MGYSTDFYGAFSVTPDLTDEQVNYINDFSNTRRMKRDVNVLMEMHDGKYGYPGKTGTAEEIYGKEGEFFVRDDGFCGQNRDESILDYNVPPSTQPGLWCQWVINGNELEWDGGEKFYNYVEWLEYLIENFFKPWGITINGEVEWSGESRSDIGKIVVTDNKVQALEGRIEY